MIKKKVCGNGVRIVHEKIPHVRSVSVGIWVKAGSNDERESEAGIAHFIEHMLFKGTEHRTARMIAEQFDRIGGELNAFTTKEATCFHTTVLKEHAGQAFTILEDMLYYSTFDDIEIEKEKLVILEEIAMCEDTPDDEVHELLWKTMYANEPIGRPVLGNKKSILSFTKQAIDNFMERLYRPERIVISIAGNYENSLLQFVEQLFGKKKQIFSKEEKNPAVLPEFSPASAIIKKNTEQAHLCIGFPGLRIEDERKYELAVIDCLLGGAMSSRLFQEVREEHGLAYSIYSDYASYEEAGAFIIYGGTSPEKLATLQHTIQAVIEELVKNGVSDEEISNAKQYINSGFLLGLENTESRMTRNGNNELLSQPNLSADEIVGKIEQVNKDNVNKLIKEIFNQPFAAAIIAPSQDTN